MTSMFFGVVQNTPVPVDESVVRSTTAPVTHDAPPAMADHAPEPQEVVTDSNPNLGLVSRQVASTWVEGEKYAPDWAGNVDAGYLHNAIVDRQVSSSGTAAARESAGIFGHGTLSHAIGIEPVGDLRDGGRLSNEYFEVDKRPVQQPAGQYMSIPPGTDQNTTANVAATGKTQSREAIIAAQYRNFWKGVQEG